MLYLTGASGPAVRKLAQRRAIGVMVTPNTGIGQIPFYRCYAADNGCFWPNTYVGDDDWLGWVEKLPRGNCLFVTVPDVARRADGELGGDPVATWEKFQFYGPIVRALGYPAALVAQDGIEDMDDLDVQLGCCDALFLGGSTEWKISDAAFAVAARARELGRWTHMGRVNTAERYELACRNLIDSADGTFLRYGPDANIARLERWLLRGAQLRFVYP